MNSLTSRVSIQVWVEGIGLVAPGMDNWMSGKKILSKQQPYQWAPTQPPAAVSLSAAEKRRASAQIRTALAVGEEAVGQSGRSADSLPSIFASSAPEGENFNHLAESFARPGHDVSPTRFHNSVHNTDAGYWGIATHSHQASISIAAFDNTFSAGLVEAALQAKTRADAVLLVAVDSPYPEPLNSVRMVTDIAGVAFVLSSAPSHRSIASLKFEWLADDKPTQLLAEFLPQLLTGDLEKLRKGVPAMRSLPLLSALARECATVVYFDDQPPLVLKISLEPCLTKAG